MVAINSAAEMPLPYAVFKEEALARQWVAEHANGLPLYLARAVSGELVVSRPMNSSPP